MTDKTATRAPRRATTKGPDMSAQLADLIAQEADSHARITRMEDEVAAMKAMLKEQNDLLIRLDTRLSTLHSPETCPLAKRVERLEAAQERDEQNHATREQVATLTADLKEALATVVATLRKQVEDLARQVSDLAAQVRQHETTLTTTAGAGKGLYLALGIIGTVLGIAASVMAWVR